MSVLTQWYQCGTWFVCSILRELAVSNLGQPLFCLSITWSRYRNAYRDLWIMTIGMDLRRGRVLSFKTIFRYMQYQSSKYDTVNILLLMWGILTLASLVHFVIVCDCQIYIYIYICSFIIHVVNCTVRCRYNAVNFLQNPLNRHPIARSWGRDMGCLLWF